MSDNTLLNAGSGGDTINTEDVAGIKTQIIGLMWGIAGSLVRVSGTNPLPVSIIAALPAGSNVIGGVTQSGTWNITNISGTISLPTGAATEATLSTLNGKVTACNTGAVVLAAGAAVIGAVTQSGTWNISNISGTISLPTGAATESTLSTLNGKVTACNTGAVVVSTQPARAATADAITAKLATDSIQNGLTALTPKFSKISAASSGDNTVVAAVTSKKIRVLALSFNVAAAVNVKFKDNTAGTDITGLYAFTANQGLALQFCPVGHMESASGMPLVINLSGAIQVSGHIVYVEV